MKTIKLNVLGIEITWDGIDRLSATIQSSMMKENSRENGEFNFACEAIEHVIKGHFGVGIDVSAPAYLKGIEVAYRQVCDDLGEI